MTKQSIASYLETIDKTSLDGATLRSISRCFENLVKECGEDCTLDFSYDYDNCLEFTITSYREENDEEYEKRLKFESVQSERKRYNDLQTLARLREQYGV